MPLPPIESIGRRFFPRKYCSNQQAEKNADLDGWAVTQHDQKCRVGDDAKPDFSQRLQHRCAENRNSKDEKFQFHLRVTSRNNRDEATLFFTGIQERPFGNVRVSFYLGEILIKRLSDFFRSRICLHHFSDNLSGYCLQVL